MKMRQRSQHCIQPFFFSVIGWSLLMIMANRLAAQPSSEPLARFWRTDGVVNAIVITNKIAYIGGDFGYLGPYSGAAGLFDGDFGDPLPGFPELDGIVNTV